MQYLTSTQLSLDLNDSSLMKIIIDGIQIVAQIQNLIYEPSKIYHTKSKQNIIKENIRSSKTYTIKYLSSPNLFNAINKLIDLINVNQNTLFSLIPDEIDIIRYDSNDFFKKHNDFVPFKSKYINYYSLLFCLDADSIGGETCLYLNDSNIKLRETITPNHWVLFMNEIEHESLKIESGHKIVLKANVVHIDLSQPQFNLAFDQLLTTRNDIINNFKSTKNNILPIYNLQDYLFYRRCFENDPTVIPFQMICMDSENNNFNIIHNEKSSDHALNNHIVWFNVGSNYPIVKFLRKENLDENNLDEDDSDENDSDEDNKNDSDEFINKKIIKLMSNDEINEIQRVITLMIYYFWCCALYHESGDAECQVNMNTKRSSINTQITKKIKENIQKIQEKEFEIFQIEKIRMDFDTDMINKIFTNEFINNICKRFTSNTINYQIGGLYYCNQYEYQEYKSEIYFGFVHV